MTGWEEGESHPAEGTLLLYLDGELLAKEAAQVQEHLTACWSCRMGADRVQEAVFAFVEYRDEVLHALAGPPPSNDEHFAGRLRRLGTQLGKRSWVAQLNGVRNWFLSDVRLVALPRPPMWVVTGFTVAIAALALFSWLDRLPAVTASELLQKATEAQTREYNAKNSPVIHQELQIMRGRRTARWELWRDTANARFRQSLESGVERRETDEAALLAELTEVLHANRMNPEQPLSAASFETWRQSLAVKREEVSRMQTDAGQTLTLRVVPLAEPTTGQIIEASLVVRARDWHPLAQSLKVQGVNEIREYELREAAYEAMPLAAFMSLAKPRPPSTVTPAHRAERISAESSPAAFLKPSPTAVELQNAEMSALYTLHHSKADLGEQIEVVRESNERIVVRGQVETSGRKQELIEALKKIPLVVSQIQTYDESAPQTQKPVTATTTSNSDDNHVAGVNHFEQQLARYFAEHGNAENPTSINRQIAKLADAVFTESSAALTNCWALRRLAERFDGNEDEEAGAPAAERLNEIMLNHLAEIGVRSRNLRSLLEPALVSIAGSREAKQASPQFPEGTRKARVMRLFKAVEQVQRLTYRLFESGRSFSDSPEQAARVALQALAELDAARLALEQDVRKQQPH